MFSHKNHFAIATLLFAFFTLASCKSSRKPVKQGFEPNENKSYPAAWWQEFPRDPNKSWEILPQEAKKDEVVLSKRTELGIFSNFAETPFEFEDSTYQSVEGFWQMLKYPDPEMPNDPRAEDLPADFWPYTREEVGQLTGFTAKRAGKAGSQAMKELDIDWVSFRGEELPYRVIEKGPHYDLIVSVMRAKLEQNPKVKTLLLKTGSLKLIPDHTQKTPTPPAWKYHEIWMEIRKELQTKD